jgi:protein-L-isoaspartate(D-aspartate) O-methyltransferase
MSDKVRSGVLRGLQGKDFVVMSRENMAILLKDMGRDCKSVQGECEVETGRNIGATYVVSGSVEDVGGGLMLCTLKVHDTNSGALLATGDVRGTQIVDLIDRLPPKAQQLMTQALGGTGPAPVIETPGRPAQPRFNGNFGGTGSLGIAAKLKAQACDRQAETKGAQLRSARLTTAIEQAQRQARDAWKARVSELEMCAKLKQAERGSCISALEQWLATARSMTVDIPAAVENVQTDCGTRQPALPAERRTVQATDVPAAERLLERLKSSSEAWKRLHASRFSSAQRTTFERKRHLMVKNDLQGNKITNTLILEAMDVIPMELFVPTTAPSQFLSMVYRDGPVPIGYDESISQPWLTAYSLEFLQISPGDRVLELKSASGYQTAVLAQMGVEVWSVETDASLAAQIKPVLEAFNYSNLHYKLGSVQVGWTGRTYDAIIATAAYRRTPTAILRLLAPGGKMLAPVGPQGGVQNVVLYTKSRSGRIEERQLMRVNFSMMPGE